MLKTIINPTLESLAVVGAIVAIRAALTYLLNRELKMRGKEMGTEVLRKYRVTKILKQQQQKINLAIINQDETVGHLIEYMDGVQTFGSVLTHATNGTVRSTVTETTTGAGGEQREIERE